MARLPNVVRHLDAALARFVDAIDPSRLKIISPATTVTITMPGCV
jgi:hypothetical protein